MRAGGAGGVGGSKEKRRTESGRRKGMGAGVDELTAVIFGPSSLVQALAAVARI